jgi:hypothetical protein
VAVGLAPVWVRSPRPPESSDERQVLNVTRLAVPAADPGEAEILGAWRLDSTNRHFGSYSALVALGDGSLLAASDSGRRLRFTPPGRRGAPPLFDFFADVEFGQKRAADIEAMTRDPATGRIWVAYEYTNRIERLDTRLQPEGRIAPPAMRSWGSNSGPEAMVRLADGRFVVLAEIGSWFGRDSPGLLFPRDPLEGDAPIEFRFRPPNGFSPVDMALLPDGRVLVLLRELLWQLPPGFASKLVVADPAAIRAGTDWTGEEIAQIRAPLPSENYEGLAVEPGPEGSVVLWLISDDNNATFQETRLLKLAWRPNEKARGSPRAPR